MSIEKVIQNYPLLQLIHFIHFLVFWLIFSAGSAWVGGWQQLAQSYRATTNFVGQKWHFQSVFLRSVSYNRVITIGSNFSGLYLSCFFPFRFAHPPLFIPWSDISVTREKRFFAQLINLQTVKQPSIKICLSESLFQKIEAFYGERLPIHDPNLQLHHSDGLDTVKKKKSTFRFNFRLVILFLVANVVLGSIVGSCLSQISILNAKVHSEKYQVFQKDEYFSIRYGNNSPNFDFAFLGIKGYSFVVIEKEQTKVVSETFYNRLGDTIKVKYKDGRWVGSQSSPPPMYMISCVIPLVGSFFSGLFIPGYLSNFIQLDDNSKASKVLFKIMYYSAHLFVAGIFSLFTFYLIPFWIELFGLAMQKV